MPLRVIETGAQYRVLEGEDGWVYKELLTPEESRKVIADRHSPNEAPASELERNYLQLATAGCARVRNLIPGHPPLRAALGEPTFYNGNNYRQRKATPLNVLLEHSPPQEKRALIDGFVDLTLDLWNYGIAETTFNCTVNHGVTATGQVILLDFGELAAKKGEVGQIIDTKRWLQARSYPCLPEDIRSYYAEELAKRLTLRALHSCWEVALKTRATQPQ